MTIHAIEVATDGDDPIRLTLDGEGLLAIVQGDQTITVDSEEFAEMVRCEKLLTEARE